MNDGPVSLNGTQGPHDGWLVVIVAVPALLWSRWPAGGTWVGVIGVLGSASVVGWTALSSWRESRDVLGASVGYGLLLVIGASLALAAAGVARGLELLPVRVRPPRRRDALGILGLLVAGLFVLVFQQVLGIRQHPSWPPPRGAVTPSGAEAATEAFAARADTRPHDAALDFAWSTAATIEPWVEGKAFFPRIFADVEAARSSVHILMFGWREGEVGTEMAALLERKLADGVEVRVLVDGYGSRPFGEAEEMFRRLAAAGAQIVVNDVLPVDRDGLYPDDRRLDWRQDEVGRADHRKLVVVDGAVAWTGGAGIEDHFENGGFHDVMVRVTGGVVRQAQAAFLTSFRGHGGPLPDDLARYFPAPADPGSTPIALAQVIPGGFVAASQAIREQIEGARRRLDLMNPYLTDRDMVERLLAAARRGVAVRLVVSETSNNAQASAALRHRYDDLIGAGVEVWELPGTVVHAKVVVADDVVSFGTVNLDSWALYRNSEIAMITRSPATATLFEERLFEPDIARSRRGRPPSGASEHFESWLWDKLAYFL
jgi:cardiolipin synthase